MSLSLPKSVRANLDLSLVLAEVRAERVRQDAKWGEQNHPDGVGRATMPLVMFDPLWSAEHCVDIAREWVDASADTGFSTWHSILMEEVLEAAAASDADQLRTELIQVAAVAVQWVQAIERRRAKQQAATA